MSLNAKKLGLAGGILWGVATFVMTWLNIYLGYAPMFMDMIVDIYPGTSITPVGSIIGLVYGFIDGFVGLFIIGWLYNKL